MATEKLIVELDAKTSKLDSKLEATERSLDGLDKSTKKVDQSFARMGKIALTAATAAAAAISALSIASAAWARELTVAANRAGETVERMQALSFASNTVGISLEKLGDISKDTNEKIGEFLATGGGGFIDFVDVMRLGATEARELASEFQTMSGPAVLQEMVKRMQEAGISSNQMSFALEGVASDATDLIPLLRDNAEGLNDLTEEFEALGAVLTEEEIEKIKRVGEEFKKLNETFSAESRQLVAEYSEEIITLINWVETAGTKFLDFTDTVATGWGNIIELAQAGLDDLINGTDTFAETLEERTELSAEKIAKLTGDSTGALEIIITKGTKAVEDSVKQDKLSYKQKLDVFSKYTKAASAIQGAFFEDNKAIQAGIIVADTATGIMRAFATSSNIYEAYANAAVVAATGIAQLSNLQSAGNGGGSISGGASGGGGASQPQQQPDFQPETSSLDFTDATAGGSSQQTIRFAVDSGDDLIDAIGAALNKAQNEGRA